MKFISSLTLCAAALCWVVLGSSCRSSKDILYLQDLEPSITEVENLNYETTIQKNDRLSITVISKQPELTAPFTASAIGNVEGTSENTSNSTSSNRNESGGHLVDINGDIVIPFVGKIKAAGKTCTQLADDIGAILRNNDYIRDATVNVRICNFKFYAIGETSGTYYVDGQRMTILEAIAMIGKVGDRTELTLKVIREIDGKREVGTIDLRSKDLFNSPYYYIKQNDIIYITPSDSTMNTPDQWTMTWAGWGLSIAGIVAAIVALAV